MRIQFGTLKEEYKSDSYVGGNEKYVANKTCSVTGHSNFAPTKFWVQADDEFWVRYINTEKFNSYRIYGE